MDLINNAPVCATMYPTIQRYACVPICARIRRSLSMNQISFSSSGGGLKRERRALIMTRVCRDLFIRETERCLQSGDLRAQHFLRRSHPCAAPGADEAAV